MENRKSSFEYPVHLRYGNTIVRNTDSLYFTVVKPARYDENSGILESDWYNAQVELLRLSSETWGSGLIQIEEGDFSLMRWYEYTLTLEPGQTLKNAVTAPLYPAIDAGYTPSLYSYTYLLSPAKTWAQFMRQWQSAQERPPISRKPFVSSWCTFLSIFCSFLPAV